MVVLPFFGSQEQKTLGSFLLQFLTRNIVFFGIKGAPLFRVTRPLFDGFRSRQPIQNLKRCRRGCRTFTLLFLLFLFLFLVFFLFLFAGGTVRVILSLSFVVFFFYFEFLGKLFCDECDAM